MDVDIYSLLNFAIKSGASDLHLSVDSPPIVRIHGKMQKTKLPVLSKEDIHTLIYDVMSDEQRRIFEEELELDFSRQLKGLGRFRINVYRDLKGEAAVFRTIPDKAFSFEDLGLPTVIKDVITQDKGLILVTGPTGSGKSTTLSTIISYINENEPKHIITIEDPVEFIHESKVALVNQREVGLDTKSFARALRSALREDPDVIVVGEMRDLETTSLAITAAETGHLVFGTLHTMSAGKTIDRIIDQYPSERQGQIRTMLAESITGIISQVLLPRIDGNGRVAAFEIMIATSAIRNMIRENKTFQVPSIIQTSGAMGMRTIDQSLINLVKSGAISAEEAVKVAEDTTSVKKSLGVK
jgi:twitching motility protein PilT